MNEARNQTHISAEAVPSRFDEYRDALAQWAKHQSLPVRNRARIIIRNLRELERDPGRHGLHEMTTSHIRELAAIVGR